MDTSKFIGLLYIGKASPQNYVDWARNCLAEGRRGENLEALAASNQYDKRLLEKEEAYRWVRNIFGEIGFRCKPNEINSLLDEAKNTADQILSSKIEPYEGVRKIAHIAGQIDFPFLQELSDWIYLEEGNHPDCVEKGWGFWKTNQKKWLDVVMREAKKLSENPLQIEALPNSINSNNP